MEWTAANRQRLFRKIGVMYQSGALFGSMTCLENVRLPLDEFSFLSKKTRNERAMELLSDVELADAADKMPSELSGGMRKRVAIARAMALDPEVVFLDEPGAGLDPITAYALDELILSLRQTKRMTFVVVSHELDSIFRIADRAAVFDKARRGMIALGDPRELKESSGDPFVRRFFNRGKLNE
jgi:phospholipid/cholesterol/gamma-HCH transport system ATP-binding protein